MTDNNKKILEDFREKFNELVVKKSGKEYYSLILPKDIHEGDEYSLSDIESFLLEKLQEERESEQERIWKDVILEVIDNHRRGLSGGMRDEMKSKMREKLKSQEEEKEKRFCGCNHKDPDYWCVCWQDGFETADSENCFEKLQEGREGFANDLGSLLEAGHGGGNWKRLVMMLQSTYSDKFKSKEEHDH